MVYDFFANEHIRAVTALFARSLRLAPQLLISESGLCLHPVLHE